MQCMKNIGILGSGEVGKTLARGFLNHGYSVMVGTRSPQAIKEWKSEFGENFKIGSPQETAKYGEILVLAVKGSASLNALKNAGESNLKGKIIIDTTNPISDEPHDNGVLRFFSQINLSLMETLQKEFSRAHFVKAFNSIGNVFMVNPEFKEKPTMFICGNSREAKSEVRTICEQFGFEVEDMGGVEGARAIEPLCILWCIPGFLRNEWSHAFRLVKK